MDKTTPRPWVENPDGSIYGAYHSSGKIGLFASVNDAEFAVKAVNSHDALMDAAVTLALVLKGIRGKAIKDTTIMDTSKPDAGSWPMKPLSQIIEEKIAAVNAALKSAKGEA